MRTATKTSPSAIARIIKAELGITTVPFGWQGLQVTKGAVPGSVYVEANFEFNSVKEVRWISDVTEVLRGRGYDVNVSTLGSSCSVYKV